VSDQSPTIEPDTDADPDAGAAVQPLPGDADHRPGRRKPRRRLRKRDHLKRSAYVLVFLLIFNHLVLPQLGDARRALHLLSDVNPLLLLLALGLQIGALGAYVMMTRATLPKEPCLPVPVLFRIQLATRAVTNLVPGGSAAGGTLGFKLLTDAGVPASAAGFTLATIGLGSAVVLNVILWVALLISIPINGFNPAYLMAAVVGLILMGAMAALVLMLLKGADRAEAVIRGITRHIPFVNEDTAARFIRQLVGRLEALLAEPALIRRGLLWATANWALDAASLWVFLRAFGVTVSPVNLLVAFGLANVLAAVPITPGGLGVVEAVLISTLVGFGLESGIARVAVITYRLAAFWLPIPLGALAYASLMVGPSSLGRRRRDALRRLRADAALADRRVWDDPVTAD
jgi:uncharacterized protein (TIRG00374 family)